MAISLKMWAFLQKVDAAEAEYLTARWWLIFFDSKLKA